MKANNWLLLTGLICFPGCLLANESDHRTGQPTNTIAVMSDDVIQARLTALGYESIRIVKTNALRYEVTAIKAGKVSVFDFHPQVGTVDFTRQSTGGNNDLMPREAGSAKH